MFEFGLVLSAILALSLYRACHKLLLLLTYLHRTKQHPVRLTGKLAGRFQWPLSFSINHLTGVWLPAIGTLVLVILLVKALMSAESQSGTDKKDSKSSTLSNRILVADRCN